MPARLNRFHLLITMALVVALALGILVANRISVAQDGAAGNEAPPRDIASHLGEEPATPVPDVATPLPDEVEVATPPPDEVAEAVTVEAIDIAFNPTEFTIAADTDVTVTLVNNGSIEHTFTIDELDIDEVLAPGDEVEITINAEAGEYEYYCSIPGHREAGQEGVMTVE